MSDLAEAEPLSTDIDTEATPSAAGGGEVVTPAEPASLRSDLETVFREDGDKAKADEPDKDDDKPEPKPEADKKPDDDAKPERARDEGGKFASKEPKDDQPKEERKLVEAPQSFMPKAKEVWRNTPHAVQAEVARLVQDHTAEREQTRATVERYEALRQYDDLAKTNGRDLRESLERMGQVEDLLQRNPLAGLNAILMEIGPRKQDGQPFSLYEVAQFVAQQEPGAYQQMVANAQGQQQQQREDPRIGQLQQQIANMQEQQAHATIVEPFRAVNPRFDELQGDIAFFLQSGKIPASLSPTERLAAAYDMAERINPPSHIDEPAKPSRSPAEQRRADDDFSGSKSIKSSPGSVTETYEPKAKSGESARESLLAEMRRMNRA